MTIVRAALLGAAAMYLLDPDRGRSRRAIVRDKARSVLGQGNDFLDAARSDARSRLQGMRALAQRVQHGDDQPDDERLVQRARARLGRVVSHPRAVHIEAEQGRLRLSGPILRHEHAPLLAAMRLVRGVKDVDDSQLVVHDSSDGVSALQGMSRGAGRNGSIDATWTPAVRLSALAGGGILTLYGLGSSGLSRLLYSGAGLALLARGGFNRPLRDLIGSAQSQRPSSGDATPAAAGDEGTDTSDDWSRATHSSSYASGSSQYLQGGEERGNRAYGGQGQQGGGATPGQQGQGGGSQRQQGQGSGGQAGPSLGTSVGRQGGGTSAPGFGAGAQYAYPDTTRMQESGSETGAWPPAQGSAP